LAAICEDVVFLSSVRQHRSDSLFSPVAQVCPRLAAPGPAARSQATRTSRRHSLGHSRAPIRFRQRQHGWKLYSFHASEGGVHWQGHGQRALRVRCEGLCLRHSGQPLRLVQKPIALPRNNINAGSNNSTADSNKPARNSNSRYASGWRSLMIACDHVWSQSNANSVPVTSACLLV
jgi:hypothetical protein